MDDNDDFWSRSSAAQDLELARREERENFASAWRRNVYAVVAVVALVAGWLAMR